MVARGEDQGIAYHSMRKVQLVSNISAAAPDARRPCSNDFNPRMFHTAKLLKVNRREQKNRERARERD